MPHYIQLDYMPHDMFTQVIGITFQNKPDAIFHTVSTPKCKISYIPRHTQVKYVTPHTGNTFHIPYW